VDLLCVSAQVHLMLNHKVTEIAFEIFQMQCPEVSCHAVFIGIFSQALEASQYVLWWHTFSSPTLL
jgi:hypothetical protein